MRKMPEWSFNFLTQVIRWTGIICMAMALSAFLLHAKHPDMPEIGMGCVKVAYTAAPFGIAAAIFFALMVRSSSAEAPLIVNGQELPPGDYIKRSPFQRVERRRSGTASASTK